MSDNGERKLSIICSKGTLDMAYPGLVLANAALMEGIDVTMFFTFWGLEIVKKESMDHLKATPLGNPAMHMPNIVGVLPGMTAMASTMMKKEIEKLDFPPVSEFLEMIHDAGGKMYGCQMAMDMMKLEKEDLCDSVDEVIGAMEFMEMSDGAQIIFI
jgi:peroxiredoxin family protein